MAETSILWTTGALGDGGAAYTMAKVIDWWHRTTGEGVHLGYLNALACVSAAPNVTVDTGAAVVWGFPYDNSASVSVNIPTPAVLTRIDRIVLRADWAAQTVRIFRIAGVEGDPAPAIVQTYGTTWDLKLCTATITIAGAITVADERAYCQYLTEVDTAMLKDLNVTAGKLATDAVETLKIKNANVTHGKLADDAVETHNIKDLNVTAGKLANDAAETIKIKDANVTHPKLSDDAVETHNIKDLNVTTIKLNTQAVTTVKIADANVTEAKLALPYGRGAFVWTLAGDQSLGTDVGVEYVAPFALTLTGGYIIGKTAPTGAILKFDVHSGLAAGVTVFTTQANRPALAIGAVGPTAIVAPDVTAIAAGTRMTLDCDQIGSTLPGADVTVILAYKYSLSA